MDTFDTANNRQMTQVAASPSLNSVSIIDVYSGHLSS